MSELALFLVRAGFLAVLWIFVFSIISVIRADLFGQKVVSRVAQANAPQVVSTPVAPSAPSSASTPLVMDANGSNATTLVIIEGERIGQKIALDRRELTIGRADNSDLVVDDEYASTTPN
jgi:cytoskeletal protein RodZ